MICRYRYTCVKISMVVRGISLSELLVNCIGSCNVFVRAYVYLTLTLDIYLVVEKNLMLRDVGNMASVDYVIIVNQVQSQIRTHAYKANLTEWHLQWVVIYGKLR